MSISINANAASTRAYIGWREDFARLVIEVAMAGATLQQAAECALDAYAEAMLDKWEPPAGSRLSWRQWAPIRQRIFERDRFQCVYCGSKDDLSVDHVIPLAKGGSNADANLSTACLICNISKGAKLLADWRKRS